MAQTVSVGPYESLAVGGGKTAPLYLIRFDKDGRCQSPLTLARLLEEANSGQYTDMHIFSHGWNNVFRDAVRLYRDFFGNYFQLRNERGLNKAGYVPAMVGIIWPSTLLVLPWESGPRIAGGAPDVPGAERDESADAGEQALQDVAAGLDASQADRLYYLAEREGLTADEALELAALLLPVYQSSAAAQSSEVGEGSAAVTREDLLRIWSKASPNRPRRSGQAGFARETGGGAPEPEAAALDWSNLDPRWPVRVASVLQMKDRAGTVGANGVGPKLLDNLLAANRARVHLVGHSYGGRVLLSSLCAQPAPQPAASLLLLEPAVSYLCFGENLDGAGRRGGYRDALFRVQQPILSTFSSADAPLTKFFHLAVIRDSDWGEQRIAGEPPNKFAALGGFGPGGLLPGESKTLDVLAADPAPGKRYPRGEAGIKIYGLDGSHGQITGHGDVGTRFTAWAHLNLVSGGELQ